MKEPPSCIEVCDARIHNLKTSMSTTNAFHAVGDDGTVFLTLRDDARRTHHYARHDQVVPLTAELHHKPGAGMQVCSYDHLSRFT